MAPTPESLMNKITSVLRIKIHCADTLDRLEYLRQTEFRDNPPTPKVMSGLKELVESHYTEIGAHPAFPWTCRF